MDGVHVMYNIYINLRLKYAYVFLYPSSDYAYNMIT